MTILHVRCTQTQTAVAPLPPRYTEARDPRPLFCDRSGCFGDARWVSDRSWRCDAHCLVRDIAVAS